MAGEQRQRRATTLTKPAGAAAPLRPLRCCAMPWSARAAATSLLASAPRSSATTAAGAAWPGASRMR
ncbi:hypothetical protein [Sphingomonas sp. CV7422]|uniref:hypothetical protein n=1 Tax=Sphingomonas sp. CV7422 TaxID=3018036 RepID=UPI0022FF2658|nr:hypothetical protein [Sphingomonas sp. CV7422]